MIAIALGIILALIILALIPSLFGIAAIVVMGFLLYAMAVFFANNAASIFAVILISIFVVFLLVVASVLIGYMCSRIPKINRLIKVPVPLKVPDDVAIRSHLVKLLDCYFKVGFVVLFLMMWVIFVFAWVFGIKVLNNIQ